MNKTLLVVIAVMASFVLFGCEAPVDHGVVTEKHVDKVPCGSTLFTCRHNRYLLCFRPDACVRVSKATYDSVEVDHYWDSRMVGS